MQVICLEEEAFYALVDKVFERMESSRPPLPDRWIDGGEAMRMLRIKAPSTLQLLRDEGRIRFSKLGKKTILYDRDSINDYVEQHAKEPF